MSGIFVKQRKPERVESCQRIASLLKKARRQIKLSPAMLNKKLGFVIPRSTLMHYEKNGLSPEAFRVLSLLNLYKIPLSSIFQEEPKYKSIDKSLSMLKEYPEFIELCKALHEVDLAIRGKYINALTNLLNSLLPAQKEEH